MVHSLFQNKKVLITGGDGFIGSHLTRRLVQEGTKVTLLIHPQSSLWRIKDLISRLKIIKADITDFSALSRVLAREKPEKIFHLAAYLGRGDSSKETEAAFKVNVQGTINLLRALEKVKYDRFLNTGSADEYGRGQAPFKEEQKISPVSPYAASKSAAFLFCDMCYRTQGRPIVTLRPFAVYGPGQGPDMFIPQLIASALQKKDFKMSRGGQTRDFVYVTDVVEGFLRAAVNARAVGQVFNLGTGKEHSLIEIAEKIMTLMRHPIKIKRGALPERPNAIRRLYCNNAKAKKVLGWRPQVNIQEGLKKTIDWYKANYDRKNSQRT